MDSQPFDLQVARDALGGDEQLLLIVVRAIAEDSPELLRTLLAANEAGDADRVRAAAHAVKGSVRYFGNVAAFSLAQQIELAAADGDVATVQKAIAELPAALDEVCAGIRPLLDGASSENGQ